MVTKSRYLTRRILRLQQRLAKAEAEVARGVFPPGCGRRERTRRIAHLNDLLGDAKAQLRAHVFWKVRPARYIRRPHDMGGPYLLTGCTGPLPKGL